MTVDADFRVQRGALHVAAQIEVQPGELLALLGPNGAGKTTILRCLAGLTPVDAGHVDLAGVTVDEPATGSFVAPEHRPIGVVFQDYLLFPHLSVIDNVAYGRRARGARRHDARRHAGELIERFGLGDYALQRPGVLSGGQAQRVALARALATDPAVLLLDEPLAALDITTRVGTRRELRRHLSAFPGASIMITHDALDAYALADRVAIVEQGRVTQSGTLAEITAHPRSRYVADLIGVNLFSGNVVGTTLTTAGGAVLTVADAPAGPVYATIHPHSITISTVAPASASARNCLTAVVSGIDRLGQRARLQLDGPLPLIAEITDESLSTLALRPGDHVNATIKATEITVFAE